MPKTYKKFLEEANVDLKTIKVLVDKVKQLGGVASIYPKLKTVSISGKRTIPFKDAAIKLKQLIILYSKAAKLRKAKAKLKKN